MTKQYINEFAQQWIEALRSGQYEQGTLYLCKDGKFCCLGVAEDLAKTPYRASKTGIRHYVSMGCVEVGSLTAATQKRLGLYSEVGQTKNGNTDGLTLYKLNDSTGATFSEIADILEKYPEYYFEEIDND